MMWEVLKEQVLTVRRDLRIGFSHVETEFVPSGEIFDDNTGGALHSHLLRLQAQNGVAFAARPWKGKVKFFLGSFFK